MKIYVALIRNGNAERDRVLLKGIESLRNFWGEDVELDIRSFIDQPQLIAHSFFQRLKMLINHYRYFVPWQIFVRNADPFLLRLTHLLHMFLVDLCALIKNWLRKDLASARQQANTAKHISSWRAFTASDSQAALVLEDDGFLLSQESPDKLVTKLSALALAIRNSESLQILNLSRPFTLKELGYSHHVESFQGGFVKLEVPTVNTTSAYVISKALATEIVGCLSENSTFSNADLLLARILLELRKVHSRKGNQIACLHADPAIFDNASLTGEIPTTL